MFRDIDELTYEDYPKRKSAAERELEAELEKDMHEMKSNPEQERDTETKEEKKEQEKAEEKQQDEKPVQARKQAPEKKKATPKKKEAKKEEPKPAEKQAPVMKEPEKKQEVKKQPVTKKAPLKKTPENKKEAPKTIVVDAEKNNWVLIAASSLVIVAVIVALYFVFNTVAPAEKADTVAAVVNGVPIYNSKVDFRQKSLENAGIANVPRETILNQLIDDELIIQEAENEGITVTESEAEEALNNELSAAGINEEDISTRLEALNITYEGMVSYYRDAEIISRYIDESLGKNITFSEEEMKAYYDANTEEFTSEEMVSVRHILLGYDNETTEAVHEKAKTFAAELGKNKTAFCDYVKEYSEDYASVPTCGEYNFSKDANLVPEFKAIAFKMAPGELGVVASQFGYHIMLKVADIPSAIKPFDEVKPEIEAALKKEALLDAYAQKLNDLKEDAIIELYKDNQTELVPKEEPQQQIQEEDNTSSNSEAPVKETVVTEESKLKSLAKCLSENAVMYSVYWAPDTDKQLAFFEEYNTTIKTVECDPDSSEYSTACEGKDFSAYPSWEIKSKTYSGIQSLTKLADYSGCDY